MAGTVTTGFSASAKPGEVRRLVIAWTSDASGNADVVTELISGSVVGVTFKPGAATPTDNYDVTLSDQLGSDILAGQGANRSSTLTQRVCPGQAFLDGTTTSVAPISICDTLTLAVSNAGNSKNGTIVVYVR